MKTFAVSALSLVGAEQVTPVQKVIVLLNGMLEKGKDEKHNEQVQFAAYRQFCDDTEEEKTRAIQHANQRIEKLNSAIQLHNANADKLTTEINAHEGDVATWTGDEKAATAVRDIERNDYQATHTDYSESIDALFRAISVLKKQAYDRKQAPEELLQLKNYKLIPQEARKVLDNFLQGANDLGIDEPDANGYEFQSGGVIEMLEKLHDKFGDERTNLEKEEMNSKHAYKMLMQDLASQIATANEAITAKKEQRATAQQNAAEAKSDLADTTATRDDDQTYLDDLVANCKVKSSDFEARQKLRAEEIEAIEKAIEIMSADNVSGHADKYLPKDPTSFLQVKIALDSPNSPNQAKAAAFLSEQAEKVHSHVLSAIAVRAAADPFVKVRKMIQDLVTRLQQEANEEAEHKGWCDKELAVNEQTRKEKTSGVERLHAEKDQIDSTIAKLTEEIKKLTAQVTELDKAMTENTKIRIEEKAVNKETVKDAKAAQVAVAKALSVLKEFYTKAGKATQLIQAGPEAPEIFDAPYKGMQSENGGVVGMLEVIQSDFARLETETKSSEAESAQAYDQFMQDSKVDKAQKNKDIEHKTNKKQTKNQDLTLCKEDLASTQKELNASLDYFDKLKPTCINTGLSFKERVQRREDEVKSLQEALKILNGEGGI